MGIPMQKETELEQMQNYWVTKSNDFIRNSKYKMSIVEQRIIVCMLSKVDSRAEDIDVCTMEIDTFCKLCGIQPRGAKAYIKKIVKELRDQSFWIKKDGKDTLFSWVDTVEIDDVEQKISLRFSASLKPYLVGLKEDFTSYKLPMVIRFKSTYTSLIFDNIYSLFNMKRKKPGVWSVAVDDLKNRLKFEESNFKELRVRVLELACKDINTYTDIYVEYEAEKKGRKFSIIHFKYRSKTPEEMAAIPLSE